MRPVRFLLKPFLFFAFLFPISLIFAQDEVESDSSRIEDALVGRMVSVDIKYNSDICSKDLISSDDFNSGYAASPLGLIRRLLLSLLG